MKEKRKMPLKRTVALLLVAIMMAMTFSVGMFTIEAKAGVKDILRNQYGVCDFFYVDPVKSYIRIKVIYIDDDFFNTHRYNTGTLSCNDSRSLRAIKGEGVFPKTVNINGRDYRVKYTPGNASGFENYDWASVSMQEFTKNLNKLIATNKWLAGYTRIDCSSIRGLGAYEFEDIVIYQRLY